MFESREDCSGRENRRESTASLHIAAQSKAQYAANDYQGRGVFDMEISLNKGTDDLLEAIDAEGIQYKVRRPRPGVIWAAAGDFITLAGDAIPYAALAAIFIAWFRAKASRRITIITDEYKRVEIVGMDVDELEKVLRAAKSVDAFDPDAPPKKRGIKGSILGDE